MRRLPVDILKEVHEGTVLGKDSEDNVLYISRIPKNDENFDQKWIRQRILGLA